MSCEQLMKNMKVILTGEELKRVEAKDAENGNACVDLDLHGLTRKQAQRLVKNIINVNRGDFMLNVIHGFNHGTALKDMVMENDWGMRVVSKNCPVWNPGRTYFAIAA